MNLSRRNFLRLFSYGSLTAIAPLESLCAVHNATITSEPFHVSMSVPPPWQIVSIEDYFNALSKNILSDDARHDFNDVGLPIVTVTRHPEPRVEFNPGMTVQADRRQGWMGDDLLPFHAFYHAEYLANNRSSTEESSPEFTQLAGVPAACSRISYDHLTEDGASARVVCRAYSLFHRDSVFFFSFGSCADSNEPDPFSILAPHVRFH